MNIESIRHGLILALLALVMGALWAAYMATHHEKLHGAFEAAEAAQKKAHTENMMNNLDMSQMDMGHHAGNKHAEHSHAAGEQHSHSGSLAKDAMQRLLRGHIHFMGLGVLAAVLLLITAFTSLKDCWKKVFGWTLGLGSVLYPPAWILMGFRTVELGPQAAEASVMWLFGPAVGLLLGSMIALLGVLMLESIGFSKKKPFNMFFVMEKLQ
ncbi:MAG: hypothetical protein Q9M28_11935 [Mariprofundaceae bacterium]|nr:hypothetical protein [Mariprofundaceae bacterium]